MYKTQTGIEIPEMNDRVDSEGEAIVNLLKVIQQLAYQLDKQSAEIDELREKVAMLLHR